MGGGKKKGKKKKKKKSKHPPPPPPEPFHGQHFQAKIDSIRRLRGFLIDAQPEPPPKPVEDKPEDEDKLPEIKKPAARLYKKEINLSMYH